ncbi:MAG: hypothetical protein HQRvContig02_43 [Haloquadratum phage sp.]|nr:MAG: hypothetical protein HQRvContig02_43 [Haloquadratum phage sp.]
MSEREWHDGVVDVADELVQEHSAEGAIERLQSRRQTSSDELQHRCTEAIAYIRREVQADA